CRSPAGSYAMRDHPRVQLTRARMRECQREPEACFRLCGLSFVLASALGPSSRCGGPGGRRVAQRPPGGGRADRGLVRSAPEVAALVGFGWWMFHVGVRGSFSAVAFITVLGALSFAGLGMLVASRARTIEAVSGLMNLVMLPMWILSGTFFSYARFPDAIQPF